MAQLVMAMVVEGSTDARFLDVIAERTALQILGKRSHTIVEVLPIQRLRPTGENLAQRILDAARSAYGYHLLLVHADADASTRDAAWNKRIQPGFALIHSALERNETVCNRYMAVIPVQMTEAWMLADSAALLAVIGTNESLASLGLRHSPGQIESIADPKAHINGALETVRQSLPRSRRKYIHLSSLYEPLARRIDLGVFKISWSGRQSPRHFLKCRGLCNSF